MNISEKDYRKLYQLQDKILLSLKPALSSFYLTGGTALGRYYLNHRFSEDLDFFTNNSGTFRPDVKNIEKALDTRFTILKGQSIVYEDYVRYYIEDEGIILKIEFVNDVAYRCGVPYKYAYGLIDSPLNILANKLSAVVGRDEPKDVYDIYSLAIHYKFNWPEVFEEAKNKAIINEIDLERRIKSFSSVLFENVGWHIISPDLRSVSDAIQIIADDLLLGKDNSLGKNKPSIKDAKVLSI